MCGAIERLHVHHLDYSHLGDEPDEDLLTLCEPHHFGLHEFYEANRDRMTLREASSVYVSERGGVAPDPGEPASERRNHQEWEAFVAAPCPACGAGPGEACVYERQGRVRMVTAGMGHKARRARSRRALATGEC